MPHNLPTELQEKQAKSWVTLDFDAAVGNPDGRWRSSIQRLFFLTLCFSFSSYSFSLSLWALIPLFHLGSPYPSRSLFYSINSSRDPWWDTLLELTPWCTTRINVNELIPQSLHRATSRYPMLWSGIIWWIKSAQRNLVLSRETVWWMETYSGKNIWCDRVELSGRLKHGTEWKRWNERALT